MINIMAAHDANHLFYLKKLTTDVIETRTLLGFTAPTKTVRTSVKINLISIIFL